MKLLLCITAVIILRCHNAVATQTVAAGAEESNVDCQGEYDAWSSCEPLEGHNTHHDKDDEFLFERGEDNSSRDCFHFQTYQVKRSARGSGKPCSHVDGSRRFRFCEDCTEIPSVHQRLEQEKVGKAGVFGVVIGTLGLITLALLAALCIRNILKMSRRSQEKQGAQPNIQQPQQHHHHQQQPEGHMYVQNGVFGPPAIADDYPASPRYPLEQRYQQRV